MKKLEEVQSPALTLEDPISPPRTEIGSPLIPSFREKEIWREMKRDDSLASPTSFLHCQPLIQPPRVACHVKSNV